MNEIFRDAQQAFQNAIVNGDLSDNEADANYAGNYMYMHSDQAQDYFKNIFTRRYDIFSSYTKVRV